MILKDYRLFYNKIYLIVINLITDLLNKCLSLRKNVSPREQNLGVI